MYLTVLDLSENIHIIDHFDKVESTTICGLVFGKLSHNTIGLDEVLPNTCPDCLFIYNSLYSTNDVRFMRNINEQNIQFKLYRKENVNMKDEKAKGIYKKFWKKLNKYKLAYSRLPLFKK